MSIYPISRLINAQSGNNIIELINCAAAMNHVRSQYPIDCVLQIRLILEALDGASNLSSASIAQAPLPAIDVTDTQADKATKVSDIWRNYPKIGLQLWIDAYGTGYIKKGQPIVFQNYPVQFPVPLISPFLNATAAVFLMGEKSRLGISVLTGQNWNPIAGTDFITITGALRADVEVTQLNQVLVKSWNSLSVTIPANIPTKISNAKINRRSFEVQNTGDSILYVGWGNQINEGMGNLLLPNGSYSMLTSNYYSSAEFWAYSVDGEGKISGQEGLI